MSYWDEYEWLHHCDSDEDSVKRGCLSAAACIVGLWLFLLLCVLLSGCKSVKHVSVPVVHTDTLYINKMSRDSIWLHDSIFVSEKQKGDTIWLTSTKWRTKYVERQVHDTIYKSRVDSVGVPYPVEVPVEKPLTWWQKARLRLGDVMLITFAVLGIIGIIRLRKKFF